MPKKVLFLGGAYAQLPIIKEAKRRGWYIITCDYLPDNPGHKLADEYHNVSTTDFEGVLELAKKTKPDFVIAYASDPAAPVAAFVSEKLGLPGNSFESVKLLAEKDKFREFLRKNGFNTPQILVVDHAYSTVDLANLSLPVIVKPTDSSGSKGVKKVENMSQLNDAVEYAVSFSRSKRVIIEEFIDNDIADIHGDGFVYNGELVFTCLGDHLYNGNANPFNPTGTTWPSTQPKVIIEEIEREISRLIKLSGFLNGPINIEARINHKGVPYIMEIGPRNGGHFVPQAIQHATNFNFVSAYLDLVQLKSIEVRNDGIVRPSAYIALHSDQDGVLKEVYISQQLRSFIVEFHQYVRPGEKVMSFQGANAAIGVLILSFSSQDEMRSITSKIHKLVHIILD